MGPTYSYFHTHLGPRHLSAATNYEYLHKCTFTFVTFANGHKDGTCSNSVR